VHHGCILRTSPFRKCFRFTELRIPRISRIPRIPSTDSGFTDSKGNVRKKSPCFVLLLFFLKSGILRIYGFRGFTDLRIPRIPWTPRHSTSGHGPGAATQHHPGKQLKGAWPSCASLARKKGTARAGLPGCPILAPACPSHGVYNIQSPSPGAVAPMKAENWERAVRGSSRRELL